MVWGRLAVGHNQALAAATFFRTDGYIADCAGGSRAGGYSLECAFAERTGRAAAVFGTDNDVFLRGNLSERVAQQRYSADAEWNADLEICRRKRLGAAGFGRLLGRIYGTDQKYRQNFSSVTATRTTETLTKLQRVPTQQMGGAVQWAQTFFNTLTSWLVDDMVDTRATDNETADSNNVQGTTVSISARQRTGGVYGEVLWQPRNWSIAFSSRVRWLPHLRRETDDGPCGGHSSGDE